MNTIIYFTRHTITGDTGEDLSSYPFQRRNELYGVGKEGLDLLKRLDLIEELYNIDVCYSSQYIRAIKVGEYIAKMNNLELIIDDAFGERKFGINEWSELPKDFGIHQFMDENFKMPNGESQKDVVNRFNNGVNKVILQNKGKRISIATHSTALEFYLMQFCEVEFEKYFKYKDKIITDKIYNCGTIEVTYDDNFNVISIKPVMLELQVLIDGTCEDICNNLSKLGFKLIHEARVVANYYYKGNISDVYGKSDLKNKCIRMRKWIKKDNDDFAFLNYNMIDFTNKYKDNVVKEIRLSNKEATELEFDMLNNGFNLVYTDDKTDHVFIKDGLVFQIQDLKGIGLTCAAFFDCSIDISKDVDKKLIYEMEKAGIKIINTNRINRFNFDNNKLLNIGDIINMCN